MSGQESNRITNTFLNELHKIYIFYVCNQSYVICGYK